MKVLSLPRAVGTAADGTPVTAHHGRYGPYIKKGDDNRTLESEDLLFTIDAGGVRAESWRNPSGGARRRPRRHSRNWGPTRPPTGRW